MSEAYSYGLPWERKFSSPENLRILPVRAAVIGVGGISTAYVEYLHNTHDVKVTSCSDRDPEFTQRRAVELGIEKPSSYEEILSDSSVEMVINLTNPQAHAEVTRAALEAGKHVFTEKPLAATFKEGVELVDLAKERQLLLACAPDTFLGPHFQTAQQLIEEGTIGEVIHISASHKDLGPSTFHPNPEPFYSPGAGPVYDWGPYYLTHAMNFLGPVESLRASGTIIRKERKVESRESPRAGDIFPVTVPTHVVSNLRFHSGVEMDLLMSFELCGTMPQTMEIYGKEGSLHLVSPNQYNGVVRVGKYQSEGYDVHPSFSVADKARGYGVPELAQSIRLGENSRLDASLGLHTLEVMEAIHRVVEERSDERQYMTTVFTRPRPM